VGTAALKAPWTSMTTAHHAAWISIYGSLWVRYLHGFPGVLGWVEVCRMSRSRGICAAPPPHLHCALQGSIKLSIRDITCWRAWRWNDDSGGLCSQKCDETSTTSMTTQRLCTSTRPCGPFGNHVFDTATSTG
jgi:hypothetical protein